MNSITAQSTGEIVIAGAFTTVNGFPAAGIARLNAEKVPVNQPIIITGVRSAGNFLLFSFNTEIGSTYVIEGSTDLLTWQSVETKVATATTTDFNTATNGHLKFFRVRTNP